MLKIAEKTYATIPCYEITDSGFTPRADLLLYHGWGSDARKHSFRGQILAAFGYRVVIPELPGHGVRGTLDYENPASAVDFLQVQLQSLKELTLLAQEVFTSEKDHFIVGHSLGGLIALGSVLPLKDALAGVVALNSTAEWGEPLAVLRAVNFGDTGGEGCPFLSNQAQVVLHQLDQYNPAYWKELGVHVPVLLTNGALDKTMPPSLNADFCKKWHLHRWNAWLSLRQVMWLQTAHCVKWLRLSIDSFH